MPLSEATRQRLGSAGIFLACVLWVVVAGAWVTQRVEQQTEARAAALDIDRLTLLMEVRGEVKDIDSPIELEQYFELRDTRSIYKDGEPIRIFGPADRPLLKLLARAADRKQKVEIIVVRGVD